MTDESEHESELTLSSVVSPGQAEDEAEEVGATHGYENSPRVLLPDLRLLKEKNRTSYITHVLRT